MRVLLIEDDALIGRSLVSGLEHEGMAVDWVRSGADGHAVLGSDRDEHAIVLLDLGLPEMSGLDLLRRVRLARKTLPILVITARDSVDDRIVGLDLGADDYIVKPFELGELFARMRAVMRRLHGQAQSVIVSGEISLDLATHEVEYKNVKLILSAREFALMRVLLQRPGMILSRAQIEEQIYGWGEEVESNAVAVLIHSIRKRFDKDIIRNVRGAGWMVTKDIA
ncbi:MULTISPECIES: response regulator [unclassified Bradyrhizobium]|uniref:response regulator n=1 Tax=unclassified Bradyrhizobium TaxID=2631580 RepID=UPI00048D68B3|nr:MULTISPECIES: response regulator [unclassified Bradyrhizobium]QIG95281.1 response regulator [Bradyrhizobium sp. 6(2017)]